MSRFIDKLNRLLRSDPQPMGFKAVQPASPRPRIQLIASLAQESVDQLAGHVTGADAGLLRISKLSSGAQILQKISQTIPDIPWGGWLQDSRLGEIERVIKDGCDFVVFPAINTPLKILQNSKVGKILEVEASLSEGLLRATNELSVDALFIASKQGEVDLLTWQHLMTFQRFADLLTKPLLISVPSIITADELQGLWEAGVSGVVVVVTVEQVQDRLSQLRQVIDKLNFPSLRKREKAEPLLPRVREELSTADVEEKGEEEGEEE
ncbi:hypothetical protein ACFLVH_05915 [Chloroflexota bacterium]